MNKILFVGDPHVQPSNLTDSENLMKFIIDQRREHECDQLILAGDLFHTHAVIRMEVLNFWESWMRLFSDHFKKVHVLVGNHDQIGDKQREGRMSALSPFKNKHENVAIWDEPGKFEDLGFIPYMSSHEKFIENANLLYKRGVRRLFCHQTFDGSRYDNGFYAPDGIDPKLLPPFNEVVSGHIHTEQNLGLVFFPGTAKWDTMSDANQIKGIWISDKEKSWTKIPTNKVCIPIIKLTLHEGATSELEIPSDAKTIVELIGSSAWIAKQSKKLRGKCRIVARSTDAVERKKTQAKHKNIFEYLESISMDLPDKGELRSYMEKLCQQV